MLCSFVVICSSASLNIVADMKQAQNRDQEVFLHSLRSDWDIPVTSHDTLPINCTLTLINNVYFLSMLKKKHALIHTTLNRTVKPHYLLTTKKTSATQSKKNLFQACQLFTTGQSTLLLTTVIKALYLLTTLCMCSCTCLSFCCVSCSLCECAFQTLLRM